MPQVLMISSWKGNSITGRMWRFLSSSSSRWITAYETCSLGDAFDATALTLYGQAVDYSKIITVEPGKRSGKPCIRGLRMTVYDVLDYLASGMTHEQILRDFPYLTQEDIQACLAFAADRERRTSFVAGGAPVR